MKAKFSNSYSSIEKEIISKLAEIEKSDQDTCRGCGGEDCLCCEIYQDRTRWVEPDQLF